MELTLKHTGLVGFVSHYNVVVNGLTYWVRHHNVSGELRIVALNANTLKEWLTNNAIIKDFFKN